MREDVLERGRLAAPPGRDRRKRQRLAEQPLGESRKKSEPRCRFEHAAAESVREYDAARSRGSRETRNAERGAAAQLERIAIVVIETPQQRVNALQARQCLQINRV